MELPPSDIIIFNVVLSKSDLSAIKKAMEENFYTFLFLSGVNGMKSIAENLVAQVDKYFHGGDFSFLSTDLQNVVQFISGRWN